MRFFWILLLCCFLTGAAYAQPNVRIGFLDIDKVLAAHSGFSESSQDLETKIVSWRNEIDIKQKDLDEQRKALEIERPLLTEEIAEGTYSNLAIINHSPSEFVIDFIKVMPGVPKAKVKSRIVLTPQHAKRLLKALNDNVSKFEAQHGPIKNVDSPNNIPLSFSGPTAEA